MRDLETDEHDMVELYCLGVLDEEERAEFEQHLAECPTCRAAATQASDLLGAIPPEAFVDGPPEDGDLLVRRVLHAVSAERGRMRRHRLRRIGGAAAVVLMISAGTASAVYLDQSATGSTGTFAAVPGTAQPADLRLTATDDRTGVRLAVRVTPRAGWVQLTARVSGVQPGQKCRVVVQSRDGTQEIAMSWTAPQNEPPSGVQVKGAAAVGASDITSVHVVTPAGAELVAAST
jgi:anti-sigma factor RsiW